MKIEDLLDQSIDALEHGSGVRAELDRIQMAGQPEEAAELEPFLLLAHRLRQTRHMEETRGLAMSEAQFDRSLQRLHKRLEAGTNGHVQTNGHAPKSETNGHHNGILPQVPAHTPDPTTAMAHKKNRQKKPLLERYAALAAHPVSRAARGGAAVVVVALLLAGMGLTVASADSLPDTPLYSIKRTTERIQTQMVSGPAATLWHLELADRRLYEIRSLTQTGKGVAPDLVGEMKNEYRTAVAMSERNPDAATHGAITEHLAQARQVLENLTPQVPALARPAFSTALDELRQEQERLEGKKPVPAGSNIPGATPTEKATATVVREEIQAVSPTPAPSATWTPGQEHENTRIAPVSRTRPAEIPASATGRREGVSRDGTVTPDPTATSHLEAEEPTKTGPTATPQPGTFGPRRGQPDVTPGPGGGATPIPALPPVTPLPTRQHAEVPAPTPTSLPHREGPPPSPTYVIRREHPRPTATPEPRREPPSPTATPEVKRERPSATPTREEDDPPPTATPGNNPVPPTATPAYRREHVDPTPSPGGG
ncbi:MAG: hypothetical protein HY326_02305 [Chloroflexi bacterium]|nr:hypothetical protein [Chloroflexota bacterium]